MDPLTIAGLASTAAGLFSSFSKKKQSQPSLIDTRTDDQKLVDSRLAKILTQGADPYGGARVAGMTPDERYTQSFMRQGFEAAMPGILRQLSGEFPEEYFNQAIADPTRRQFNERVAPVIRENSELTGNRFADRSAIELGQARGDVESSILQERGRFGLETYRDPLNAATQLTGALNNAEALFSVPRTIEQARLDAEFNEFMRTNPESGGLIDAMLRFSSGSPYSAYSPTPTEGIGPSLIAAGGSLLGAGATSRALGGFGSEADSTVRRLSEKAAADARYRAPADYYKRYM